MQKTRHIFGVAYFIMSILFSFLTGFVISGLSQHQGFTLLSLDVFIFILLFGSLSILPTIVALLMYFKSWEVGKASFLLLTGVALLYIAFLVFSLYERSIPLEFKVLNNVESDLDDLLIGLSWHIMIGLSLIVSLPVIIGMRLYKYWIKG